jgi:hypothetical protein
VTPVPSGTTHPTEGLRQEWAGDTGLVPSDYWADEAVEVRHVHPFEATKAYHCPGCNTVIGPGTGHVVAVPREAADLRRHWHRPCWTMRHRRRPGR